MQRIKFENFEDVCTFLNNFKDFARVNELTVFIDKKNIYRAKHTIKKYKLNAVIESKQKGQLFAAVLTIIICISCVCSYMFIDNRDFQLKINCKDKYLELEILEYINNNEKLLKANELELKVAILNKFEEVAFVEISKDKHMLLIDVTSVDIQSIEVDEQKCIYAHQDGIVTKVVVKEGCALVKRGDVVHKGDKLIEGKFINALNEQEKDGYARGEVYAKTYIKEQFNIPKIKIIREKTNNKKVKYMLFGRELNRRVKYKYYDKITTDIFFKNSVLKKITYQEIKEHEKVLSFEDIEVIIANKVDEKREEIGEYAKFLNHSVIQKEVDSFYKIVIYYEIEQCISIDGGRL